MKRNARTDSDNMPGPIQPGSPLYRLLKLLAKCVVEDEIKATRQAADAPADETSARMPNEPQSPSERDA